MSLVDACFYGNKIWEDPNGLYVLNEGIQSYVFSVVLWGSYLLRLLWIERCLNEKRQVWHLQTRNGHIKNIR